MNFRLPPQSHTLMNRIFPKLLLSLLTAFPMIAVAGPWCSVADASENCRFQTADQCYQYVNYAGGYCKPNPRELGIAGNRTYCVITEGQKRCTWGSKAGCLRAAMAVNGGCVRNTELDLERRARGEARIQGCVPGSPECADDDAQQIGGLEAAGYGAPAPVEPVEPIGDQAF